MRKQALCVQFDGKLKLEFCGATITSDGGLLPFRELDEAFRLTEKGSKDNTQSPCGIRPPDGHRDEGTLVTASGT